MVEEKITLIFVGNDNTNIDEMDDDDYYSYSDSYPTDSMELVLMILKGRGEMNKLQRWCRHHLTRSGKKKKSRNH